MRKIGLFMMIVLFALANIAMAQEAAPTKAVVKEAGKEAAKDVAAVKAEPAAKPAEKPALSPDLQKAYDLTRKGKAAVARLKDFTAVFYKKEYKGGDLPLEKAFMKFRKKPRSVYMKWLGEHKHNQEVIWKLGWNSNKLRAHKGSFPDITVNLKTTDWMAMKDSRHPITQAGFPHTVQLIAKDVELSVAHPEWNSKVKFLGEQTVLGAPSYCFEAETDKKAHPEYYASKAHICVHKTLNLPNKVQIWNFEDGQMRLVEDYGYEDIKVNVGLVDADFDVENENYNF